jgi:hypothetical protein
MGQQLWRQTRRRVEVGAGNLRSVGPRHPNRQVNVAAWIVQVIQGSEARHGDRAVHRNGFKRKQPLLWLCSFL